MANEGQKLIKVPVLLFEHREYSGSKMAWVVFLQFSLQEKCFLVKLGAFLGHFQCDDHPGHAVPDLPRPLANLGRHPGQRIEEKPAV